MRTIAIALGTAATALATMASAQVYFNPYPRVDLRDSASECWNPRAGQFEQVRPGEYQDDLDMSRCRAIPGSYYDNRYYDNRVSRDAREECWNPRARSFEQVRPGERQDDLDYTRCRMISSERYYRYR
ncbi:MAG: hypothetical protein ABIR98_06470 [Usitatibacter sp.]